MTAAAGILLAAAAVGAVADWAAVGTGRRRLEAVAKPATLALLVGAAVALDPASGAARAWFVVALLASLAGDVALLPAVERFTAGLAAFLAAHLAYVAGFLADGHHAAPLAAGAVLVVAALATAGRAVVRGARRRSPALAGPVAAYALALAAMVVAGWSTGEAAALAGTTLFLVSDGLLAWDRFVAAAPGGRVAVHVTYHLAQGLLVVSLAS
ncbi:MAG TPA: lysoplasmalogenase family protein [Acidimicrobiales bacterium]